MFSTGEQAGFEVTITRPDGTKFNEYEVKHYNDEKGRAVTECWLESEDDAVYQIKIEKRKREMTRFVSSSWSARCYVDGWQLGGSAWHNPSDIFIKRYLYRKSEQDEFFKGDLTFAPEDITPLHDLATVEPGAMQAIASIAVHLQPAKFTSSGIGPRKRVAPIGVLHGIAAKLAMVTKTTNERPAEATSNKHKFCYDHPDIWQIFIFNYRHRASLESMGVIESALLSSSPPSPSTSAAGREQVREAEVDEDRKPHIRQAGAINPVVDKAQADQQVSPSSRSSASSGDDVETRDRRSDDLPVAGPTTDAGAVNSAQSQRCDLQPANESCTDKAPIRVAQDPVAIGRALSRLGVDSQPADTSSGRLLEAQDRKPVIISTAGPSSMSMPIDADLPEDSDSDDDSWKTLAAIIADIQKLYAKIEERQISIRRLKRQLKGKGKTDKRASKEDDGVLPEDSDSDDDSWKEQAAIIADIQRHYAEIEKHQVAIKKSKRELKGKGRADKRARTDDEGGGSGRAGNGKKSKAEGGLSIDLTEDAE